MVIENKKLEDYLENEVLVNDQLVAKNKKSQNEFDDIKVENENLHNNIKNTEK